MLNMAKVKKKKNSFCAKNTLMGSLQVSERFFIFYFYFLMSLHDVMKGGTPYMCISPGRVHPRTH